MTAPADLPPAFTLDPAPASTGDGEDLTLEGILRSAGIDPREVLAAPPTAHEQMIKHIRSVAPDIGSSTSGRSFLELNDPQHQVIAWLRDMAGRPVGSAPTWIRIVRADLGRGALFVVSNPNTTGEAELMVLAERGMLTRSAIVDVCRWIFFALEVRRVVVRIPVGRDDLTDYTRRAGFAFEGIARGFFFGEADASTWAMTLKTCRWLQPKKSAPAQADTAPFQSLKAH